MLYETDESLNRLFFGAFQSKPQVAASNMGGSCYFSENRKAIYKDVSIAFGIVENRSIKRLMIKRFSIPMQQCKCISKLKLSTLVSKST